MTRSPSAIIESAALTIRFAIVLGDENAAYRLTVALVRRVRELTTIYEVA